MMKQIVRTRIAPSPTGEDLHIGSVYMALINHVFAAKNKGQFIIRIEDTDRERFVDGAEERMLKSLAWVGIPYAEGPDKGGQYGPYRQSERLVTYQKHAHELVEKGDAYYCFCTPERLAQMRNTQQQKGQPPMYDGLCKLLDRQVAANRISSEKYVIRLNVPDKGETSFDDEVRGRVIFENKLIDDQILLKSDGFPTYHLAVVIDDHLMNISHVIRGEEWISSTPKHILLYLSFGWELPTYAHLPLLRNPDKSKLSKRRNPVWASWYREQGFLPEAVLNYLGTLTWGSTKGDELFTLKDMIRDFSLDKIKTTAPVFDLTKLTWMNGEYIRKSQNSKIKSRINELFNKKYPSELVDQLIPLAKERMKKLSEFEHYIKPFLKFSKTTLNDEQKIWVSQILAAIEITANWDTQNLHKKTKDLINGKKWNQKDVLMALRLSVTSERVGLPLFETMEILGKNEVIKRIKLNL
jgi:glutamyl-tRNA synthetase